MGKLKAIAGRIVAKGGKASCECCEPEACPSYWRYVKCDFVPGFEVCDGDWPPVYVCSTARCPGGGPLPRVITVGGVRCYRRDGDAPVPPSLLPSDANVLTAFACVGDSCAVEECSPPCQAWVVASRCPGQENLTNPLPVYFPAGQVTGCVGTGTAQGCYFAKVGDPVVYLDGLTAPGIFVRVVTPDFRCCDCVPGCSRRITPYIQCYNTSGVPYVYECCCSDTYTVTTTITARQEFTAQNEPGTLTTIVSTFRGQQTTTYVNGSHANRSRLITVSSRSTGFNPLPPVDADVSDSVTLPEIVCGSWPGVCTFTAITPPLVPWFPPDCGCPRDGQLPEGIGRLVEDVTCNAGAYQLAHTRYFTVGATGFRRWVTTVEARSIVTSQGKCGGGCNGASDGGVGPIVPAPPRPRVGRTLIDGIRQLVLLPTPGATPFL